MSHISLAEKFGWQHLMAHFQKPPYRCKSLADRPSYSPFCFKFHCHVNEGCSGKILVGIIRWPIPKKPLIDKKILQISLTQTEL